MVMTSSTVHVVRLRAEARPDIPGRLLSFYAAQGLVPESIDTRRVSDDELVLDVTLAGIDFCRARHLAASSGRLEGARSARLFEGVRREAAADHRGVLELSELCV